jgi:hypothetical protein
VRNARFRKDPEGRGRTQEQIAAEFAAITMTEPQKAAQIIHRGIEAGKARILVGPDAYLFDILTRLAPTHYYDVLTGSSRASGRGGQPLGPRDVADRADPPAGIRTVV